MMLILLVSLLLVLTCNGSKAEAQESRSSVRLDGRIVFRVSGSEQEDARTRARQIEQRLAAVLESPPANLAARVRTIEGESGHVVELAGRAVVRVSPADAEENGTTTDALAFQWAKAISVALDRAASRRGSPGERFLVAVQSSIQTAFARLAESAISIIPKLLAALLVLGFFWALASAVRWLMRIIFRRVVSDLTVENLIKQLGYYTVWGLGLVVAAGAFGLDPGDVATGLGLTSLALGFALKDILSNFVSGLLILTLRPFHIGDQIVIGETEGSVERIELRATLIRTYDGRIVSVPNSETFTSRVTNNTASPIRRASIYFPLSYDSDLLLASEAAQSAAVHTSGVLGDPLPSVRVRDLGNDGITLELRFWTDSSRSDFVATSSCVRRALLERFRAGGIALPDQVVEVKMAGPYKQQS